MPTRPQAPATLLDIGSAGLDPSSGAALLGARHALFSLQDRSASMSLFSRTLSPHPRRRIILALVLAILLAGFAQAAHFHKDELAGHESQTDIHCLLCLYAAGTAGPPAVTVRVAAPAPRYGRRLVALRIPLNRADAAPYQARAPPAL